MPETYQLVNDGPTFTPLRYGLLSAADEVPTGADDTKWQMGTVIQGDLCAVPSAVTGGPCKAGGITKVPSVTGIPGSAAQSFSVYAWIQCGPVGHGDELEGLRARTTQLLTNGEGRAVERVFWTGVASNGQIRPKLAANAQQIAEAQGAMSVELQSAATVLTTGGVDVVEAMGLLEGHIALCYGGEGIIHVPAQALPHLVAHHLVEARGAVLRTMAGHKVAVYASNNREGPTGAEPAAGSAWFYVTGNVVFRRSGIKSLGQRPAEFIGKADNTLVYVVERTYVLDWDCCHGAAQVSLYGIPLGTVGS
jgi:hypothetical protein